MRGWAFRIDSKHHCIYLGDGEFVTRLQLRKAVCIIGAHHYLGKDAVIVYHGGQAAADRARARVGEHGWNLVSNNCEHFCSECCDFGHHSEQVLVSAGKLGTHVIATTLNVLFGSKSSFSFHAVSPGGFSTTGGFGIGLKPHTHKHSNCD